MANSNKICKLNRVGRHKKFVSGQSPTLKNLLIQEKNILTFIEELGKLRGAALKIGQLLSLEANDFLPEQVSKMLGDLRNKNFHMPNYQLGEVLRENYGDNFLDNFSNSMKRQSLLLQLVKFTSVNMVGRS